MATPPPSRKDQHTLYIHCHSVDKKYTATKDQIMEAFESGVRLFQKEVGCQFSYHFWVNVPSNASGDKFGFCYLFVTNPCLYQAALATDGPRLVMAPTLSPSGEPIRFIIEPCVYIDWADKMVGVNPNVLRCSLPNWVDSQDLRAVFSLLVDGSEAQREARPSTTQEYPKIYIGNMPRSRAGSKGLERVALLVFEEGTADSRFALNMARKLDLKKLDPVKKTPRHHQTLFFEFAQQGDLDSILEK